LPLDRHLGWHFLAPIFVERRYVAAVDEREQAKQARQNHPTRSAVEDAPAEGQTRTPLKAIPLFRDRPCDRYGRIESAIDFFDRVWRPLYDAKAVAPTDLLNHDRSLYNSLSMFQTRRGKSINDLIPWCGHGPSKLAAPEAGPKRPSRKHARSVDMDFD